MAMNGGEYRPAMRARMQSRALPDDRKRPCAMIERSLTELTRFGRAPAPYRATREPRAGETAARRDLDDVVQTRNAHRTRAQNRGAVTEFAVQIEPPAADRRVAHAGTRVCFAERQLRHRGQAGHRCRREVIGLRSVA